MDRAEFIKVMAQKLGKGYFTLLVLCLVGAIILRIVNNESLLNISAVLLAPVLPAGAVMAISSVIRILDLHKHNYRGMEKYVAPSPWSIKLVPYNIIVPMAVTVPPVLVVSLLFELENHPDEHTFLYSAFVLISLAVCWFFGVVNPYIKSLVSCHSRP